MDVPPAEKAPQPPPDADVGGLKTPTPDKDTTPTAAELALEEGVAVVAALVGGLKSGSKNH